jgi:hypothetical protein
MAWDYELGLGAKESLLRQLQPLQLARMISMNIGQLSMSCLCRYRLIIKCTDKKNQIFLIYKEI